MILMDVTRFVQNLPLMDGQTETQSLWVPHSNFSYIHKNTFF